MPQARADSPQPTSVVELLKSKGYVTEEQLATLPKKGQEEPSRRFSSSWDLFRAGVVNLKALNECHKVVRESPGKSLKQALIERGYVDQGQIEAIQAGLAQRPARNASPRRSWSATKKSSPRSPRICALP
jgi:hypothetical protein